MANKLYEESAIEGIAEEIRELNGTENTYKVGQMASALQAVNTTIVGGLDDVTAEVHDIRLGADGTTYSSAGDAVRGQVGDLKNAVKASTGNEQIAYTVIGGYYTTNGSTVNVNSYTTQSNFNAAIVNCSEGDVFTVNGRGGNSPRLWAFADSSNNILSVETDASNTLHKILVAPANAAKLIINNNTTYAPDAVSYYGELMSDRVLAIEYFDKHGVGDSCTYNVSVNSSGKQLLPDGSLVSVGQFWNVYSDFAVKTGDIVCFKFDSYSGTKLTGSLIAGVKSDNSYDVLASDITTGQEVYVVSAGNYTKLWVQIRRSETENNVSASFYIATTANGGISAELLTHQEHTYYVEKDGSGDFTNLAKAIESAEQFMDSVVYVGAGTWNILDELGSEYVQSVSSSKRGIVLKNRVHVIFSSEALVTCIYEGINGEINPDTVSWLSAFNAGEYGFTLENCRIQSRNVRYAVHDEMGLTNSTPYHNRYINCQMSHSNQKYDPDQTTHGYGQCIGGGLGTDGYIEISGCVFENPYQYSADSQGRKVLVSYHTQNSSAPSRSQIEITGCYFKDAGTCRGTYINTNTDVTTMLVNNNSFGKEPFIGAETSGATVENIEMIAWNNEIRS